VEGGSFFSGILSGFGGGLLTAQKDQQQQDTENQKQLLNFYLKGIETGVLNPDVGWPLVAGILTDPLQRTGFFGRRRGGGGTARALEALMDPANFAQVLSGAHQVFGNLSTTPPAGALVPGVQAEPSAGGGLPPTTPPVSRSPLFKPDSPLSAFLPPAEAQLPAGAPDLMPSRPSPWARVTFAPQAPAAAPPQQAAPPPAAPWGLRVDGTPKGSGFFGNLMRPGGGFSGELSIGVTFDDGKEVLIPSLVPSLTAAEVQTLLTLPEGQPVPKAIVDKAVAFARPRLAAGKSPFAEPGEQQLDRFPQFQRLGTAPGAPSGLPAQPPVTPGRPHLFRSQAEREAEAARLKTIEIATEASKKAATEQAGVVGKFQGELQVMQGMVDRGLATDLPDAQRKLRLGSRAWGSGVKVIPGTMVGAQVTQTDPAAKDLEGNPLEVDPKGWYQRVQVPTDDGGAEFRYIAGPAPKPPSVRERLTGDALQAFDMVIMEQGINPSTWTPASPEEESEVLRAAGTLLRKARDLKNTATQVRIDTGRAGQSDEEIGDLAQQLVDGNLLPSQLSRRSSTYNRVLTEANRRSKEQTGKAISFTDLQLQYYAAQRMISSLNGPQMVRFQGLGQAVVNTIDEVRDLGQQLRQGGVQVFNRAKRDTILQVYGNTPQSGLAARYVSAVNTLKEEFANLAQGGYAPTEPAWKLASEQVNGNYGLQDLEASLIEAQRLINYRLKSFDQLSPRLPGGFGSTPGPTTTPQPTHIYNPATGKVEPTAR